MDKRQHGMFVRWYACGGMYMQHIHQNRAHVSLTTYNIHTYVRTYIHEHVLVAAGTDLSCYNTYIHTYIDVSLATHTHMHTQVLVAAGADVSLTTHSGDSALSLCNEGARLAKRRQGQTDGAMSGDFEVI